MKDKIISYLMKSMRIEVAVAGIIAKDNRILLTKRRGILVEGGKWSLPGGHVKKWEKAEKAIKREIKEEIGLNIKKSRLLFVHEESVRKLNLHTIVFVFLIDVKGKGKTNWEVSKIKWFKKDEIENLGLAFTHKDILRKFWKMKK